MYVYRKILVTGGAGFIGSAFIRKLLLETDSLIYNIDKLNYASDLTSINSINESYKRHKHLKLDLYDFKSLKEAIFSIKPNLIVHFAAESHVDRSLENPLNFIENNIIGTFNLLEATRLFFNSIPKKEQDSFLFHHISTDEVFGSLGEKGSFNEASNYDPRSPYSATKAASDHLVLAWHHSYGIPIKLTNCSNNYGPYQFPEKLIPLTILKCLKKEPIPIYGNGLQIRDWLHVEDHVDALFKVIKNGKTGQKYCIGGHGEKTNLEVVKTICSRFDQLSPQNLPHSSLIKMVEDRPGHDIRYSIDPSLIQKELFWEPRYDFNKGIYQTISWYLNNEKWIEKMLEQSGYSGERLGISI